MQAETQNLQNEIKCMSSAWLFLVCYLGQLLKSNNIGRLSDFLDKVSKATTL